MTSADHSAAARPPAITREALAAAGLTVLRREGLDALSMRKVAAELGVRAASLYYHVQDKEQLLDLVADGLTWDTRKLAGTGDWSVCLREMAHGYYRYLHANRDTARLMAGRRAPGPNLMNLLDAMLGRLRAGGFSDQDAAWATLLMANYVQGFVLQEQQPKAPRGEPGAGAKSAVAQGACEAAAESLPNIGALMALMADGDTQKLFAFGVDRLIDGLRARLSDQGHS
ncbi:TetR/AcrR family tetracycline transcriptional repressor [Catenulispora sp. GP43]|uniref:TetR/AcrR family transcriptional regulator n=1 Tax=Catenulispora sp. GP43 TaxID=3156263 RepID=UPI003516CD33